VLFRSALTPEHRRLYAKHIAGMRKFIPASQRMAVEPEKVAAVVQEALTARRPRARYVVGTGTKLQVGLLTKLPSVVRDRVLLAVARQPRRPCQLAPFVKRNPDAPPGFFALEAAGLRWLAVDGGVRCAEVVGHDEVSLTLTRLESAAPSPSAAHDFGVRLAVTHDADASAFGAGPDGWAGDGYFGPMSQPLPMSLSGHDRWGEFYADERLAPMAELARPRLSVAGREAIEAVIELCRAGRFDDNDRPARLHGDLWSGNVMWTSEGVVLIDPAAHGGHRETDLAMLALFGCPFLDVILAGYQSVRGLGDGWRDRIGLHQLYPLLAHVVLFGGGYARQAEGAAARVSAMAS
jgi:fructosamine-3-kinase